MLVHTFEKKEKENGASEGLQLSWSPTVKKKGNSIWIGVERNVTKMGVRLLVWYGMDANDSATDEWGERGAVMGVKRGKANVCDNSQKKKWK